MRTYQVLIVGFLLPILCLMGSCARIQPSAGCSPQNSPDCFLEAYARYQPLLRAVTHVAASHYFSSYPHRVPHSFDTIAAIRADITQDQVKEISFLRTVVRSTIPWSTLTLEEQAGVELLLVAVESSLMVFLESRDVRLGEETLVVMTDILDWVAETALIYCDRDACIDGFAGI